jgi:TnpA family transposase
MRGLQGKRLADWLTAQLGRGALDTKLPREEMFRSVSELMVRERLVMPAGYKLRRALGAALRSLRREESDARFELLQRALGIVIEDLPAAKRWKAARELMRYPPAYVGRANLHKMDAEHRIFRELSAALARNGLDTAKLLRHPECEERLAFVERRRPSLLAKWERRTVLEAIPFYLAGRLCMSVDALLTVFVRKASLLHERVREDAEEGRVEESMGLLERTGPRLRVFKAAYAEALATGSSAPLRPFKGLIAKLYAAGETAIDRHRLHRLIGSRGKYTRKLARRLTGLEFTGHDAHAEALVRVVPEVLRFAPFNEEVPESAVRELAFLDVPGKLLRKRQVFEPVVLVTLAEHLWAGRVTVPLSRRYGDVWSMVPASDEAGDAANWIAERRKRFEAAWRGFEAEARKRPIVEDGQLAIKRPKSLLSPREERHREERHRMFIESLHRVSILEVILRVHRRTGFLDEIRLPKRAPHQLPEDQRLRLAAGILAAMGMNLALDEMAAVLGRGYRVGRVQHFCDLYMTKENLKRALRRVLASWDARRLGEAFGRWDMISVDGVVVGSFQNNLLSRYHYRRGRTGMTVYWFRRDDGIPTCVKPLGNQEWESWHALDEILQPLTSRRLQVSCGDTHAQFLGLWALAELTGKDVMARFRRPASVLLYKPSGRNRAGLAGLRAVRWDIIQRSLPCMLRLAKAVRAGTVSAVDALRRLHLVDEHGHDVGTAFRELGKVARTEFLLRYAMDEGLQRRVHTACNHAENWNFFHSKVFWGNGGRLRSNDPRRQEETLLALTLLLGSTVYDNVDTHGRELRRAKAPSPVFWDHIMRYGKYQFRRSWFRGVSREDYE